MAHLFTQKSYFQIATITTLTILLSACAADRPEKPTRVRPDLRQKVRSGKTLDEVAPARGEHTLTETVNSNPVVKAGDKKCSLNTSDELPCDAIIVETDVDGKILNLTEEIQLDNLDAFEIKSEDLKKEGQDASGKGGNFTVTIESKKGKHVSGGKDVLYLTYVLPLKKSEVKEDGAKIEVFLNDRKLENSDDQSEVSVSQIDDKVIVRIMDKAIFESIHFQIEIQGELTDNTSSTDTTTTTTGSTTATGSTTTTTIGTTVAN